MEREEVWGERSLTLKWIEPAAAAAALFVCISSVHWSHQEASSVCEALVSQRIPSPSYKHTLPLLSRLLSASSSLTSHKHGSRRIRLSRFCVKKHPLLTTRLFKSTFQSFPLLLSCPAPGCILCKGHDPVNLLLTPAWPLQVSFSVSCSCGTAKSPDNPITQSLVLSRPEPEQVSVHLCVSCS